MGWAEKVDEKEEQRNRGTEESGTKLEKYGIWRENRKKNGG